MHITFQNRKFIQGQVRQSLARGIHAVLGNQLRLTRKQLMENNATAWQVWCQLVAETPERAERREELEKLLMRARHLLYEGNDGLAALLARQVQRFVMPIKTSFDFRLHLYCEEILRDQGERWTPQAAPCLLQRACDIAEGWAVQRHYLNLALSLASIAHYYRALGTIHPAEHREQYTKARKLIVLADETAGVYACRYPLAIAKLTRFEIAFHKSRIGVESEDRKMAEEALLDMKEFGADDPRSHLDRLRAEISYFLLIGNKATAEEKMKDAWEIYEHLSPRSPYTFFSLGFREASLRRILGQPTAMNDMVKRYFQKWPSYPQVYCFARMLNLLHEERQEVSPSPLSLMGPGRLAIRTSVRYFEDALVNL